MSPWGPADAPFGTITHRHDGCFRFLSCVFIYAPISPPIYSPIFSTGDTFVVLGFSGSGCEQQEIKPLLSLPLIKPAATGARFHWHNPYSSRAGGFKKNNEFNISPRATSLLSTNDFSAGTWSVDGRCRGILLLGWVSLKSCRSWCSNYWKQL